MSTTTSASAATPSSSSTTLWATASKEWVIQPKPKPGRKPKKDMAVVIKDGEESDAKGRRMQNRAAQRAFRERKQSQLAELQARLHAYEQGEIERNVALQNIAKMLKDENERLRQENAVLQAKISQLQQQEESGEDADRKRGRDESPSYHSGHFHANKKSRSASDPETSTTLNLVANHLPSPASLVSTPRSDSSDTHEQSYAQTDPEVPTFPQFDLPTKVITTDVGSFTFGCGFCDETTLCMCREISTHDLSVNPISNTDMKYSMLTPCNVNVDPMQIERKPSILDNLPAYQPPVPLKRKAPGTQVTSIFPVTTMPPQPERKAEAICTGDPANCAACADDDFGKAFCTAINDSSANRTTCDCCPSQTQVDSSSVIACKNESSCSGCPTSTKPLEMLDPEPTSTNFIPTNNAWQQIKAHPNAEFADLTLLAEVVASRSRCLGPQIILTQPPQPTERVDIQRNRPTCDSPPPRLVPEEILLACGRRNMRTVHADGVRDALRLLDAKFT